MNCFLVQNSKMNDGEYELFDADAMRRAEAAILGDMEDANPLLEVAGRCR